MEMRIDKFVYEDYMSEDYEDIITIEVTSLDGDFVDQYDIVIENKEVIDYSGIAELDGDDITFIKALGLNINKNNFLEWAS